MLQSVSDDRPVDDDVLNLVAARVDHILASPGDNISWEEFAATMDAEPGPATS